MLSLTLPPQGTKLPESEASTERRKKKKRLRDRADIFLIIPYVPLDPAMPETSPSPKDFVTR